MKSTAFRGIDEEPFDSLGDGDLHGIKKNVF